MISCLVLERPGTWRAIGVTALWLIVILPAVPLLWHTVLSPGSARVLIGAPFVGALHNSAVVALLVAAVSFGIGLPLGVLTALYEIPGRKILLALASFPLLVPSFLWAIGWSALAARLGSASSAVISGAPGCLLVFSGGAIPLVLLVSYIATMGLSGSQVDAARLAGGERTVLRSVSRYVAAPALLAAGLGGVLTLSDPGPGQILGLRTAASEILTSFSALYDFSLAGRQCAVLASLILVTAAPLAFFLAPRFASEVMVLQSRTVSRLRHRGMTGITLAALLVLVLAGTIAPLLGLVLPLAADTALRRAWEELARTAGNTFLYAVGAGTIATTMGFLLALCAGRHDRLRIVCLALSLVSFSLPPALTALGVIQLAAAAPAWGDPFLRSRLTVCIALGLRFLPIATVLGVRAWGSTSISWTFAAGIHGVSVVSYLYRVLLPFLLPAGAITLLLVALLASADISTVLLLHPPGERSFPLAIFTVMANAPEALVASLCLLHIATTAGLLIAVWIATGGQQA